MGVLTSLNWWPIVIVAAFCLTGLGIVAKYFARINDNAYVIIKKESWLTATIFFAATASFVTYLVMVRETINGIMSDYSEPRTSKIVPLALGGIIVFMVVFVIGYYLEKLIRHSAARQLCRKKPQKRRVIRVESLKTLIDKKPGNYIIYNDGLIVQKDGQENTKFVKVNNKKYTLTREDIDYLCQFKDEPGKRLYLN